MADSKLSNSTIPISNYNIAVVSHCPSQQTATIVLVKKPSVFSRILNNYGISSTDGKDDKTSEVCTREKTTYFICKLMSFFHYFHQYRRSGLTITPRRKLIMKLTEIKKSE